MMLSGQGVVNDTQELPSLYRFLDDTMDANVPDLLLTEISIVPCAEDDDQFRFDLQGLGGNFYSGPGHRAFHGRWQT